MEPANERSLGKQLLQTLNGFIEFKLRTKQTERRNNGSSNDKGGFGARKRRKLMRAEAARRRSTPQPPPPPPALPCGRCRLLCTCLPPPSSQPSPALTTLNNGLELVTETDNLIFSQMIDLDKLVSNALGVRGGREVNMENIIVKVTKLIKENIDMSNTLKELAGKIQPCENCAQQHIPVTMASQTLSQHARSASPCGHGQQAVRSAHSCGQGQQAARSEQGHCYVCGEQSCCQGQQTAKSGFFR